MWRLPVEAICAGVAVLVYINTFTADFVYDDSRAVLKNYDVRTTTPVGNIFFDDFWGTPMVHSGSHKSYRPITILTFRLNYAISEFQPWSYHVTNVFLHSITTWLFVVFLKSEIFIETPLSSLKSAAAGLLFAVHPIHAEAVSGIVGRADVLSTLFVLATILSYANYCNYDEHGNRVTSDKDSEYKEENMKYKKRKNQVKCNKKNKKTQKLCENDQKHQHALKIITELRFVKETVFNVLQKSHYFGFMTSSGLVVTFAACAIFSKENGFCALPLCAVYDVWIRNKLGISSLFRTILRKNHDVLYKKMQRRTIFLTISTTILLCVRVLPWTILTTNNPTPTFSTADNPASTSDCIITRTMTFLYLPAFNFLLLLCPTVLSYDWGDLKLLESIWDFRNVYSIAFYIMLATFARYIWTNLRINDGHCKEEKDTAFSVSLSCNGKENTTDNISHTIFHENSKELFKALLTKRNVDQECNTDEGIQTDSPTNAACLKQTKTLKDSESIVVFRKLSSHSDMSKNGSQKSEKCPESGFHSCHLPESTNSSGYATESGEEGCEDKINSQGDRIEEFTKNGKSSVRSSHVETTHKQQLRHPRLSKATRRSEIVLISFAMMIIPFLPATNIFFYVGFVVAERFLYLPSVGFCILVTEGGFALYNMVSSLISNNRLRQRWRNAASVLAISYLLVLSVRTIVRSEDWSDELNLYRSGIPISPAKSWANLGNVLKVKGRTKEAESAYINALNQRGNMADVHYNLGLLYQEQRRYSEALDKYSKAIQYRHTLAVAHLNTGIILAEQGKFKEAEKVYRHTAQIDDTGLRDPIGHQKTRVSALYNLGCMFASQGKHEEALAVFLQAVKRRNENYEPHSLFNMLGQSFMKLSKIQEAEYYFRESLRSKNDHVPAHLTYASLLAMTGRGEEAENLYRKAIEIEPENHVIYNHFGKFYADRELYHKAAGIMSDAVMTKSGSSNYDTVMSSAEYHRHIKDYGESESYYRMATRINPKAAAGHVNLGAILHLQKKYNEARKSYERALILKPSDPTTLKNLQKLDETSVEN